MMKKARCKAWRSRTTVVSTATSSRLRSRDSFKEFMKGAYSLFAKRFLPGDRSRARAGEDWNSRHRQ